MNDRHLKIANIAMLVGAIAGAALFLARAYYAFSFTEPLQSQTRGAEYEMIFPIWKYIQGLPLYLDSSLIPYTLTGYNWLFYVFYGEVAGTALRALDLADAWLPTITHFIGIAGTMLSAIVCYLLITRTLSLETVGYRAFVGLGVLVIFFGPLTGFWSMTTAPDLWAVCFSLLTLWVFVGGYASRPLTTILIVCGLVFVSWSFKQNYLQVPAGIGFYLLARRRWMHAILLAIIPFSAIGAALLVGGPVYAKVLYLADSVKITLTLAEWWRNFVNFCIKSLPIVFPAAALGLLFISKPELRRAFAARISRTPELIAVVLALGVAIIEGTLTSSMVGAGENHYFLVAPLLFYLLVAVIRCLPETAIRFPVVLGAVVSGNLLLAGAVGTVFAGWNGVISHYETHVGLVYQKKCMEGLSKSIFIDHSALMLPWMVPANEHFVLSYSYLQDREAGLHKERGGVGGLINEGYFDLVALLKWRKGHYDGSDLELYPHVVRDCDFMEVYGRAAPGKKNN